MRYPISPRPLHPSSFGLWRGSWRRTICSPTPLLVVAPSTTTKHTTPSLSQPSPTRRVQPCALPFRLPRTPCALAFACAPTQEAFSSCLVFYLQSTSCIHRIGDRPWICIPSSNLPFPCPNYSTPYRRGRGSNQVPLMPPFHS